MGEANRRRKLNKVRVTEGKPPIETPSAVNIFAEIVPLRADIHARVLVRYQEWKSKMPKELQYTTVGEFIAGLAEMVLNGLDEDDAKKEAEKKAAESPITLVSTMPTNVGQIAADIARMKRGPVLNG